MPRYSLRTLLIIVLIAGPLLALGWGYVERVIEERRAAERVAVERRANLRQLGIGVHLYSGLGGSDIEYEPIESD